MRSRREEEWLELVALLEAQIEKLTDENKQLRIENARLHGELETAREEAEAARVFVARKVDGTVLYEGNSESAARHLARQSFWQRPHVHTVVVDEDGETVFDSRRHGYVQRPDGSRFPAVA